MPSPEIVDRSQSITVIPGEAANFFCLGYSHGTLKYDWKKKNSKNLLSSSKTTECTQDNTMTYSISNTQPSAEGWYCCVATNEGGSVEECAWLEVDSELSDTVS